MAYVCSIVNPKTKEFAVATTKSNSPSPKIQLFLSKINQEMIKTKVGKLPPPMDCTYASWKKSCCILDFSFAKSASKRSLPKRGVLFRKESDGGMMWNARTGAVYKLNDVAYHALLDIDHGLSEIEVAKRNDLDLKTVQSFFRRIKRIA